MCFVRSVVWNRAGTAMDECLPSPDSARLQYLLRYVFKNDIE